MCLSGWQYLRTTVSLQLSPKVHKFIRSSGSVGDFDLYQFDFCRTSRSLVLILSDTTDLLQRISYRDHLLILAPDALESLPDPLSFVDLPPLVTCIPQDRLCSLVPRAHLALETPTIDTVDAVLTVHTVAAAYAVVAALATRAIDANGAVREVRAVGAAGRGFAPRRVVVWKRRRRRDVGGTLNGRSGIVLGRDVRVVVVVGCEVKRVSGLSFSLERRRDLLGAGLLFEAILRLMFELI